MDFNDRYQRLHQAVDLAHDAAIQLNVIMQPYRREFVKHVAAEIRKQEATPKLDLVDLCRRTRVSDAPFKTALSSGSWNVAKKK